MEQGQVTLSHVGEQNGIGEIVPGGEKSQGGDMVYTLKDFPKGEKLGIFKKQGGYFQNFL